MVSNLLDKPVPYDAMALGEIGLTGEVRPTPQLSQRIGEAVRLGFASFILPKSSLRHLDLTQWPQADFHGVSNISEAFRVLGLGR